MCIFSHYIQIYIYNAAEYKLSMDRLRLSNNKINPPMQFLHYHTF